MNIMASLSQPSCSPSPDIAFGVAVWSTRRKRSMSLAELSALTGVPITRLCEYEAGSARATSRHIVAIAIALDSTISGLFSVAVRLIN